MTAPILKHVIIKSTVFCILLSSTQLQAQLNFPPYKITTMAGLGNMGSIDGLGNNATFSFPNGISVDKNGNVYVADKGNNKIRKITPTGFVSIFAGSGSRGSKDGPALSATFDAPHAVAVDKNHNIYVADTNNHKIRKITPDGIVSTLAGSGFYGSIDGLAAKSTFAAPEGVAVDSNGNIYVADTKSQKIRKITPSGMVTTLAGSGAASYNDGRGRNAKFNEPKSIATDRFGNLYVTDYNNHAVRKISSAGVVTTLAGRAPSSVNFPPYQDGQGISARFFNPHGISVDIEGNVYVTDTGNQRIRSITSKGVVSTLAGSTSTGSKDGPGNQARFNNPLGIAVDGKKNLYISDSYNHKIRKGTPQDPEIDVQQTAGKSLVTSTSKISFGTAKTTSAGIRRTFTIRNTGTTKLTGISFSKSGSHQSDFTVTQSNLREVAPGASATFTVTFKPAAIGARTASIRIASNDRDENPFIINLAGQGAR
ncbi:MAG: choice-of-anchor D domain-containing protein [Verrucomicrobiota bacterium]